MKKLVWLIHDLLCFFLLCVLRCWIMSLNFLMYFRLQYLMYVAEIKSHVLKHVQSLHTLWDGSYYIIQILL